jgi:hypothetical protein
MAGILDPGDSRIVSRLLNDVNDPSPGVPLASSSASGSIIQPYFGLVGKRLVLTAAMASKLSDTTVGTLFEGIYQYVQVRSTASQAPARGGCVYWDDYENYIVTTDVGYSAFIATGDNSGLFAGVLLSAPTKGNYCFIQIAGKANVLFKTPAVTKSVSGANAGDMVVQDATNSNRADVLANATGVTWATAKLQLGVAIASPTGNAISLVDLWNLRQVMGGLGGF